MVCSQIPNTQELLFLNSVVNIWALGNLKQKKQDPYMMRGTGDCLITILKQETQISGDAEREGKWKGLKKK